MHDERGADAAFMLPVLVFAEGGIAHIRPAAAIADVSIRCAGQHAVALPHGIAIAGLFGDHVRLQGGGSHRRERGFVGARCGDLLGTAAHGFGATAVILQEKDERVVVDLLAFQFSDHAAYALVHAINHCGIDFHTAGFERLVLHIAPFLGLWGEIPFRVDDAELFQAFPAHVAGGLVAAVVFAFVFGDVGFLGVHGPVGGGVGEVDEERLVLMLLGVVSDEARGVICERVRVVILLGLVILVRVGGDELVIADEGVGVVEAASAVDGAVEALEAALQRPVVFVGIGLGSFVRRDVPFAGHVGVIPGGL